MLRKPCPREIPRSGTEGAAQNCYVVFVKQNGARFFVAREINQHGLLGSALSETGFDAPASVPLNFLIAQDLEIIHYYGLATVAYSGISDYVLNGLTGKEYIKTYLQRIFSGLTQWTYNRQKLVMLERMALLRFLVERNIQNAGKGAEPLDLMVELYSLKWLLHPKGLEQEDKLRLYLDSFVSTGELRKSERAYHITDRAISTLDRYEEQERRHRDNVRLQRQMVLLTLVIAVLALIQAGLIRLPVLIDFSGN
jgi:hypothetical protein